MRKYFALGLTVVSMFVASGCPLTGSDPPIVTHQVDGSYADCLSCHEDGSNGAPRTDHARKDECLSCHGFGVGE